jgi:peptidoglycan hydrolase-like protein with peptidoglycan-binding domain
MRRWYRACRRLLTPAARSVPSSLTIISSRAPPLHQQAGANLHAGPVDDVMGPRRRKAVIAFQRACRPLLDGIPGPKTQAKFRKVCGY